MLMSSRSHNPLVVDLKSFDHTFTSIWAGVTPRYLLSLSGEWLACVVSCKMRPKSRLEVAFWLLVAPTQIVDAVLADTMGTVYGWAGQVCCRAHVAKIDSPPGPIGLSTTGLTGACVKAGLRQGTCSYANRRLATDGLARATMKGA